MATKRTLFGPATFVQDNGPAPPQQSRLTSMKARSHSEPPQQPRSILKPAPSQALKRSLSAPNTPRTRAVSDAQHDCAKLKAHKLSKKEEELQLRERERQYRKRIADLQRFENARKEEFRRTEIIREFPIYMSRHDRRAICRMLQVQDYYHRA